MKKNSQGFAVVETILILVIVGLIGFVGWYVWHAKNNADKTYGNSNNSTAPTAIAKPQTQAKTTTALYENKSLGFSFSYPKDWHKDNGQLYEGFKEDVTFTSPDFKLLPGSDYGEIKQGGSFSLQVYETKATDIEEYAKDGLDGGPFQPFSKVQIDDVDAYRGKCGHPVADGECLVFVKSGGAYTLQYRHAKSETISSSKYKSAFDKLVNSFKFD
jgi:hypothetical protein